MTILAVFFVIIGSILFLAGAYQISHSVGYMASGMLMIVSAILLCKPAK